MVACFFISRFRFCGRAGSVQHTLFSRGFNRLDEAAFPHAQGLARTFGKPVKNLKVLLKEKRIIQTDCPSGPARSIFSARTWYYHMLFDRLC